MKKFPKPWYRPSRGVWYVTLNGKQINLGPNKEEAFERYRRLLSQPQNQAVPSDSLPAIVDAFLEWTGKHRSPETYEWYRYRLQRFIEQYPDLRASDLRPFHVQQWVDGYDFSTTSRRNYLRSVKRCLKWAHGQGYLETNPIASLEVPVAERREVFIHEDEYQRLLSFIPDQTFRDLVVVTWVSGCRPQESLRVEARHVDLANERWVFPKSESKKKRFSRVVYLPSKALEITKHRMEAFPQGPLFRNSNGNPWTTEAVNCAFQRLRVRLGKQVMRDQGIELDEEEVQAFTAGLKKEKTEKGRRRPKRPSELQEEARRKLTVQKACRLVPNYSLYALRHSWATHALKRGLDPLTVAILMGHQDPSTLAKVYQHLSLSPKHLLDQARKPPAKAECASASGGKPCAASRPISFQPESKPNTR